MLRITALMLVILFPYACFGMETNNNNNQENNNSLFEQYCKDPDMKPVLLMQYNRASANASFELAGKSKIPLRKLRAMQDGQKKYDRADKYQKIVNLRSEQPESQKE